MNFININDSQLNEATWDNEIWLIGSNGEQLGIISAKEAYFKAQDEGLYLVKISTNSNPPVYKIIDYGKYKYELVGKEKEAKRKQQQIGRIIKKY